MYKKRTRKNLTITTGSLVTCLALMLGCSEVRAGWWNRSWHFRSSVEVEVDAVGFLAEYQVNFSVLAEHAGQSGRFDENSVRVVSAGKEIPSVFSNTYGYDAATCAVGRLKWVVEPAQRGETKRRYEVYFDLLENGRKPVRTYPDFDKVTKPRANLLPNPKFDVTAGGKASGWQGYDTGYVIDGKSGHSATPSVRCANTSAKQRRGVVCEITLNQKLPRRISVSGWSKAERVSGIRDNDYSIYVDITYDDGSKLWARTARFNTGTHDWERSEVWIEPTKPVKSLSVYALFRGHTGTVWFDDLSLQMAEPEDPPILASSESLGGRRRVVPTLHSLSAGDGFRLKLDRDSGVVRQVATGNRDVTHGRSSIFSGFFVKDVGNGADFIPLRGPLRLKGGKLSQASNLPGLNIELQATYEAKDTHIEVAGEIVDTSGKDRAITLSYRLPIDVVGWQWGENVLSVQTIDTEKRYQNKLYPFLAIDDRAGGIALGIPIDMPCVFALTYDARNALRMAELRFDFGLTGDTAKFPSRARFRFIMYGFAVPRAGVRPASLESSAGPWGFRSALKKYYTIFPEFFVKRVKHEGIWLWGAGDLSTRIPDLDDFGFGFDEGPMCPAKFDNEHNIYALANTCQPMQHWIFIGEHDEKPSVSERQAAELAQAAARKDPKRATPYQLLVNTGIRDKTGSYVADQIHNDVWEAFGGTGRRWSMAMWVNGDPELPEPNMASSKMAMTRRREERAAGRGGHLNGAYIDNVFWRPLNNYRRDHFKFSDLPLTFDPRTKQPVQPIGWGMHELVEFVGDKLHSEGKFTMGNLYGSAYTFMAPLFDVGGSEMAWHGGDRFNDWGWPGLPFIRSLAHRRAFMYQKPIPMLVSGRTYPFPKEAMEQYMKICMFWGVFPGTDYAAPKKEGGRWAYWREKAAYERDRPLFKKYLPTIRQIARAGWEPLTHAWVKTRVKRDPGSLLIERFGYWHKGNLHFSVRNEDSKDTNVTVMVDTRALEIPAARLGKVTARELTSGAASPAKVDRNAGTLAFSFRIKRKDTIVLSIR